MYFGGAIIGAATLAIGALRRIGDIYVNPTGKGPDPALGQSIPLDAVLAYGFYFTILFAIVCLPVQLLLTKTAQAVVNEDANKELKPAPKRPEPTLKDWLSQQKDQKDILGYLGLEGSPIESLKTALAVLAPILGSLTSLLLPGK
jgi:hypothetical protein